MLKFNKVNVIPSKIDQWIQLQVNVLLIGEKGVGKTQRVLDAFKRNGLKYAYFSGSTLDPWIHLIGIPKVKGAEGKEKMEFILPSNLDDDIEALFIDEYNRCFTGDTLIQLADGYSVPIKDLVGKEEFFVYSYDTELKKAAIGRGHSCSMTQKNAKIVKVTLDNGAIIRCTENHKFLCSDGTYREAKDLKKNQSLMALYKKQNKAGYESVKATVDSKWRMTYHLADEYNVINEIYSIHSGIHRHHIDFDKNNNTPRNIMRVDWAQHFLMHSQDFEFQSKNKKQWHKDNPEHWMRTLGTPESKEKAIRNSIKTRKGNLEYLNLRSKCSSEHWNSEKRQKQRERAFAQWRRGSFTKHDRGQALKKNHLKFTIKRLKVALGGISPTQEKYVEIYNQHKTTWKQHSRRNILSIDKIIEYCGTFDNFVNYYNDMHQKFPLLNHRVVSIEDAGYEDVYDFTVDKYHNFLLGSGVFVHNCHKLVKNALLELQQFKSINGRQFPKLKMVWAAINPPKDESDTSSQDYDVEHLDPAQLDRFHVIVELPNQPDKKYFTDKYGDHHGNILINWWKEQSEDAKKILSPRRLDYIGDFFNRGGDVHDLLPVSANTKDLITKLSTKKEDAMLHSVFANPTEDVMKLFLLGDQNYLKYKDRLNEPRFWKFHKYLKQEYICANIKNNDNYKNYALLQGLKKDKTFVNAITEVSNSTKNNDLLKVLKLLEAQNLDISKFEVTMQNNTGLTNIIPATTKQDTFSLLIAGGSTTKKVDLTLYRSLGTSSYVTGLDELVGCWSAVPNHYDVINFTFAMLGSFQTSTVSKHKSKILPLVGVCCTIAKQKLNAGEIKQIKAQIHINKGKIGDAAYNEFINYLRDENDDSTTMLTEEFSKKVSEASVLVTISSNI